jgi:hypothetical protein
MLLITVVIKKIIKYNMSQTFNCYNKLTLDDITSKTTIKIVENNGNLFIQDEYKQNIAIDSITNGEIDSFTSYGYSEPDSKTPSRFEMLNDLVYKCGLKFLYEDEIYDEEINNYENPEDFVDKCMISHGFVIPIKNN